MKKKLLAFILTLIIGFIAGNLIAYRIQDALAHDMSASQTIASIQTALIPPWHLGVDRISILAGLAGSAIIGLIWIYQWGQQQKKYRDGIEYGSARWASPRDMAPYTSSDPRKNLQMTQTEGLALDTRQTKRNLNTLVIGSSGSGKTRTHVIPNILTMNMNYACTDPKGELYEQTHTQLETHGYTVKKLDLVDFTTSTQFNPLNYIDPSMPDTSIMRLVTNIMDNTNPRDSKKTNSNDSFWDKAERSLLTSMMALVYYLDDDLLATLTSSHTGHTLNTVADLVNCLEASEQEESKQSKIDMLMESISETIREEETLWKEDQMQSRTTNPVIIERHQLMQGLRFALTQYKPFTQGAGETKKSIIISLGVRLAPIQVSVVRQILSTDTMHIDQLGAPHAPKMAIFLALSDEDPTFNFIAAIFYQCLFDSIIRRCRTYPNQQLATPLHCFLDEFANIGRIPNFDKLIGTIRSRHVSVSIILQALSQLKTMYDKSWETVTGNCDNTLFLGGAEPSTTEWIAKMLGKETIDTRTSSTSKGRNGSYTINYQRTGRDLLTPEEIAHLDNNLCLYMLRGVHPFKSRKLWDRSKIKPPLSTLKNTSVTHIKHATLISLDPD